MRKPPGPPKSETAPTRAKPGPGKMPELLRTRVSPTSLSAFDRYVLQQVVNANPSHFKTGSPGEAIRALIAAEAKRRGITVESFTTRPDAGAYAKGIITKPGPAAYKTRSRTKKP